MKKLILISIVLSLMGVAAYVYDRKKTDGCVYIGLYMAKENDRLGIIADGRLFHHETFHFGRPSPFDYFAMSKERRYIMVPSYCPEDSVMKLRLLLNGVRDTTYLINVRLLKGLNINCHKGRLNIIYDFKAGGMNHHFIEG